MISAFSMLPRYNSVAVTSWQIACWTSAPLRLLVSGIDCTGERVGIVAPRAVHTEGSTVVAADAVASLLPIVSGQAPIVARGPSAHRLAPAIASRSTSMPMNDRRKKFFLPTLGLSSRVRRAPSSEGSTAQKDLVTSPNFAICEAATVNWPAGLGSR
jgi:hypothetical protein